MKALTLLLVIGVAAAQSPWQQFGPHGATVAAMATVPGLADEVFFIPEGFPARLYHSYDLGASWTVLDTIPDLLEALAVDPTQVQVMYAAGRTRSIYRSVTNGSSWEVRGSLPVDARVRQLAVNPQRPTEVWASADVPGSELDELAVFRSGDGGGTWTMTRLDTSYEVKALALALDPSRPQRVLAGGSVGNTARLFLSANGGAGWSDISTGIEGTCAYGAAFSPVDSLTIFCATDAGLYLSSNMGSSWTMVGSFPAFSVAFAPASPFTGYAGSDYLVFRSGNNGFSWSAETTAFAGTGTRWLGINPNRPIELFAASGRGIYHTSDGGFSWTDRTPATPLLTIPDVSFFPAGPETAFAAVPGYGALVSHDRGINWTEISRFPGIGFATGVAANTRRPESLVCVTRFDSRLHLTTDRGDSWVSFNIATRFEPNGVAYHPVEPDTLYAWGGRRDSVGGPTRFVVYKSSNQGQSWSLNVSRTGVGTCEGFLASTDGETLFAWGATDNGPTLLRTANRGQNWTGIASGLSGIGVRDFAIGPDTGLYFCATSAGVFRSQNYGAVWTRLGLSGVTAVLPDTSDPDQFWAGTDTGGVYFTDDAGFTWERDTINLFARTATFLKRHPAIRSAVYLGTAGAGLFGKGVIAVAEQGLCEPVQSLIAVTPTITAGRVVLHVAPSPHPVLVSLYSADGRLVERIARLAPGTRRHAWNVPDGLRTGAYVMVCETPGSHATARLLVSR